MYIVIGLLAAIMVIGLLGYITIQKPRFGMGLSFLSVTLIIGAIVLYHKEDVRVEKAQSKIPVEQIHLSAQSVQLSYGNYYQLKAKVHNGSQKYMLYAVNVLVSAYDCPEGELKSVQNCRLLQEKEEKIETRTPAGGDSNVESYIIFDQIIPAKTQITWKVKILNGIGR